MQKEMVISANPHETRVAILEEGQLCEYYVEREKEFALVGSIYKGRVTRVLPGMQSAFVDIGLDSDAFLYVTDFLEGIEEFEPIVTTVENKAQKMEEQGGAVYPPSGSPAIEPNDVEAAPVPVASPDMPGFGESVPAAAAAPAAAPPPAHNSSAPDRPHYESRNRGGGRDFGRRGGRGRFNRRGGGRGGDRRYSRELPPSKYASPRSYEERPGESGPVGHLDIILPGESLAKYREKPPVPVSTELNAPVLPAEELLPPDPAAITPEAAAAAAPESVEESAPLQASQSSAILAEPRREARPAFRSSFGGLEPLPGESLSKWRQKEPVAETQPELAAAPALHEEHEFVETHDEGVHEIHESEAPEAVAEEVVAEEPESMLAEHAAAELSEEEAAALAEHVAEAQSEEAAREESRLDSAADDDATEAEGVSLGEPETPEEEAELEEEEEAAEGEGMIAPPVEGASEMEPEPEAITAEASLQAAAAESAAPGEQQPWRAQVRTDFRARMQHPGRRGRDRGRRDDRGRRFHGGGHGHRPQQRRPQLIADLLKQGQEIIVQIAKEPLGKKGARITSHIALPGRYLVYMPTLDHSGVSRKIASAEDRSRLRHLVKEAQGSAGGGFIVRTAAASASPDEIRTDVEFLTRTWTEIKTRAEQRKAPSLMHRDLNLVERILRDYLTPDFSSIWVDSEEGFAKVVEFMSRFQPELVTRVKLYTKETPVFEEFGIQQEIDKGLRPKVWLKSGGYIVINHTEALVAIDVNTGKFVGKGSTRLEDTIVRTNLEAVKEIVRQMRLRDLGGIIVIDFIDMEDRRNREKVMAALEDALRADRAPSKMLRFNEFGLIAITRKRTKQALERTLCQPCPYCTGSGMVKSVPTLCYEIQTEARKMAPEMDAAIITLRVHPEIAKALKTRESGLVEELERWTRKTVIIQADPTLHWEQYDIY
jgi:Rne/Rng family ribonuclease